MKNGWAVGHAGTILRTSDGGIVWTLVRNVTANNLKAVHFADVDHGWIVGEYGTILRTTNGGVSFVRGEDSLSLSHESVLGQNYPNPFNPSTTIKYELPRSCEVRLSVCDILGREVSVLVNERRNAGYHEVRFDGSGLSSGVYFYRMQVRPLDSAFRRDSKSGVGSFTETKKLLIVR